MLPVVSNYNGNRVTLNIPRIYFDLPFTICVLTDLQEHYPFCLPESLKETLRSVIRHTVSTTSASAFCGFRFKADMAKLAQSCCLKSPWAVIGWMLQQQLEVHIPSHLMRETFPAAPASPLCPLSVPRRAANSSHNGGSAASTQSHFPHKAFWVSLSASLLLVVIAVSLTEHLRHSRPPPQSLQIVRITAPDQAGLLINQSAAVDQQNDLVTFSVTSPANQTSTVLFDIKRGLICYKPAEQDSCFLQEMEQSDYDNVHSLFRNSTHKINFQLPENETQRQTEFLGVLAASQVDVSKLEEPLQTLCQNRSVHWARRAKGPGKQRLVYFCIDICFPSNICVSVCFYYLPE
ncbi:BRICHOS domain-containing protein 5 isoform X2 [Echeneis naucrates]|uniref:BRICHOS domain-containing protein 5 isoform X2 n=1 Tax=Echeneis naucrates TaxID=173247 RepID=UPI001114240C|nr:BRICHOS domain-containing protein 5 isoform X2 [Echeneis naucrates]